MEGEEWSVFQQVGHDYASVERQILEEAKAFASSRRNVANSAHNLSVCI